MKLFTSGNYKETISAWLLNSHTESLMGRRNEDGSSWKDFSNFSRRLQTNFGSDP